MSRDLKLIQRESYDFLTFFGDCGGITSAVIVTGTFFVQGFGNANLFTILANRLYKDDKYNVQNYDNLIINSNSRKHGNSKKIEYDLTNDELKIPYVYGWFKCYFMFKTINECFYCCKSKRYKAYEKQTINIQDDIDRSMDIITHVKRFRMHGLALNVLMEKRHKRIIGW